MNNMISQAGASQVSNFRNVNIINFNIRYIDRYGSFYRLLLLFIYPFGFGALTVLRTYHVIVCHHIFAFLFFLGDITIRAVGVGKVTLQGKKTGLFLYMKPNGDVSTTVSPFG